MRRLGNLGRTTQKKHQKSAQSMCSAALYRQAGLQSVVEALKVSRQACSDGTLHLFPKMPGSMTVHGFSVESRCQQWGAGNRMKLSAGK